MPATVTREKVQFKINLDNGTTATGDVKTVSVNLGTLSTTNYDVDKAIAIANLLEPCLTKTIYSLSEVITNSVEE